MKAIEINRSCGGSIILVAVIFSLVFYIAGCGKKGDPVYPEVVYPAAVSDLTVSLEGKGIELSWNAPDKVSKIKLIKILKSEIRLDNNFCPTCPRNYSLITELSLKDPMISKRDDGGFGYRDNRIRKGFLYSYRVLLCTSSSVCSEESSRAELKYE